MRHVVHFLVVCGFLYSCEAWSTKITREINAFARKLAAGAVVGATLSAPIASAASIPSVGAPAPDFTLPSNQGKDISLSDLKKKTVFLFICESIYSFIYKRSE